MEQVRKDIFEEWRSYENDVVLLRPVRLEDAAELLKVYSDEKARRLFNCDNFPRPSYFDTLEQMENEIRFYLDSYYKWKCFVRWTVVNKESGEAIGTIEDFRRDGLEGEPTALLRIDLRSDCETKPVLRAILELVRETAPGDFGVDNITTKAVPEAAVRREVLAEFGFLPSPNPLVGEHGEEYGDYFIWHG